MRRETQNILLVLLGGALLKIGINGDYLRYVKPAQHLWVLAGGAVMLALGVVAIVRDVLAHRGGDADDGHGHHHVARAAWLLMLPVLAVFLVAPPALGSDSVTRTEARVPVQSQAVFPPLPAGNVVPLSLTELVTRAGWDAGGSLNDRTVELTGFVTHAHGSVLLARMVITCCAADAYPLTVRMQGSPTLHYPDDTWILVTGQVVPGTATMANRYTPDLVVTSAHRIAQPPDPYED